MADNIILNENTTVGQTVATKEFGGVQHELVIAEFVDGSGNPVEVSATNPLPVAASIDTTGLATSAKQDTGNTSLASIDSKLTSPITVTGTVATGGLTDTQLRATPVPVSGTVTANTGLTQPLTDTQLRATPVPVSGTVTVDTSLLATAAKQDTGNTSLASIKTNTDNLAIPTTIFNGKKVTVTAGTRVALSTTQAAKSVAVTALSTNTGLVYVGNVTVASTNGLQLIAGQSITIPIADLATVNIDTSVSGEGVTYLAVL